ncbi:PREDICTED: methyltransferase-like protein 16 homolog [Dufourea novaeangliae]|uniref:U6 small nuclear RNA (adenine-(43)-N(6))-methyltransferase n=1 Tax=Dufourea novaeangliae TaxID=178035 RepID=A0A154PN92_DUFNO|nr:PREDICTED: methyltransferase-like protein 16 homolog [Dufourea novaeangliae]KZC13336.1 Methyltransferase-like protein 16 [Dufourea novaeangliae]
MSLRKFMHPRNKYKKVPDFKKLAVLYPAFRNVANVDLTGKVKIDFKNEKCLRVLTEVLLKHDFNLDVRIPPNKLVPTLPLRLNYVLWIEDLMKHSSVSEMKELTGIDIGTGAVCIYPLLCTKIYGNRMIATEVDETSIQTAIKNVENNNLQHLIKVVKVNGHTIFQDIVKEHGSYHFTMCNPPFFETEGSDRITKQQPPRNAPTGNKAELTVKGGERAFVTQIIDESIEMKENIKIYTTMFGRRSNLLFLLKLLKKRNIENATWTEFCQGHTKRWGLAWTFLPKDVINLTNAPVIRKSGDYVAKLLKEKRPTEIQFPMPDKFSSFDNFINFLEESIEELHIHIKELNLPIDDFNGWSCQLVVKNDTWSHARRKRRLAQRQINQFKADNVGKDANDGTKCPGKELTQDSSDPFLVCNFFAELIECEEEPESDSIRISMVFEKESGVRNALETFKQYLINKLNIRNCSQKQHAGPQKKKRKRLKKSGSDTRDSNINQCGCSLSEQNIEYS